MTELDDDIPVMTLDVVLPLQPDIEVLDVIIGGGGGGTGGSPAKRVTSAASTATLTVDTSTHDMAVLTAQAAALTIATPTGSPVNGRQLMFRIKDNGTARAITWTAPTFRAIGVTLPTTTVISKTTYVGAIFNSDDSRWDVIAVGQEL